MDSNIITITNIDQYTVEIMNGTLIATRKTHFLTEEELFKKDLVDNSLLECKINNEVVNVRLKYASLLKYILLTMPTETILEHTRLNMVRGEKKVKGYRYNEDLGLSIQGVDGPKTLKEVFNMARVKGLSLLLKIKLNTGNIVHVRA